MIRFKSLDSVSRLTWFLTGSRAASKQNAAYLESSWCFVLSHFAANYCWILTWQPHIYRMAAYLFCSAIFLSLNYSNAPVGDFDISMSKMCLEKFNHIYVYHKYALRSSSDKPLSGYSVDEVPPEIIRVEVAVSISNFGVSLLLVLKSPSSLHSSILLHRKRINTRLYSRLYLFCKKKKKNSQNLRLSYTMLKLFQFI